MTYEWVWVRQDPTRWIRPCLSCVWRNTAFNMIDMSILLREVACTIFDRDKNLADEEASVRMYLCMCGAHSVVCRPADFRCSQRCCKVSSHLRSDAVTSGKYVPTFRSNQIGLDCLTLKINKLRPFQTSATRRSVPEHLILQSFRMPEGFSSVILIPNRNRRKTKWWTAQKLHSISPLFGGIWCRSLKSQWRRASQEFALKGKCIQGLHLTEMFKSETCSV